LLRARQDDAPAPLPLADADIQILRIEQHATEALLQGPQRRPGIPRAVQADGFGTLQGVAVARHVALPVLARTEQAPVESQGWQGGGRAAIGAGWAFATVLVDGLDQLL